MYKTNIKALLLILSLVIAPELFAQESFLRLRCADADAGAMVFVDGAAKGECPLDLAVPAGAVTIKAVKELARGQYREFEQTLTLVDGTFKRIDVVLGAVQFTPEGRALENERLAALAEQEKLAQERQAAERLAAQQQAHWEAQQRQAEEDANRGMFDSYAKAINDSDDSLVRSVLLTVGIAFTPISTISDILDGKEISSADPAAFANPESMMARAQRTTAPRQEPTLVAVR